MLLCLLYCTFCSAGLLSAFERSISQISSFAPEATGAFCSRRGIADWSFLSTSLEGRRQSTKLRVIISYRNGSQHDFVLQSVCSNSGLDVKLKPCKLAACRAAFFPSIYAHGLGTPPNLLGAAMNYALATARLARNRTLRGNENVRSSIEFSHHSIWRKAMEATMASEAFLGKQSDLS